ncbi:hypothetical protein [Phenylobacterium sp. J367]|uniref:hypothetical protein n=1 Tax=Phenylobacterium sp. J367 TaxID=2898435 RepID=UPI0021510203|nr:hypothetical protein [Phenylobacterium sp. J367]MCR5877415.1 hypothetical protein [Phenylobacterium sp. J367]
MIALGLVVVLRNSYAAKKAFVRAHRRWPTVVHPLRRLMRKEPEIAPVFWQAYLRVERFALPKRYRLGVRGRHFVKRKFGGNEA